MLRGRAARWTAALTVLMLSAVVSAPANADNGIDTVRLEIPKDATPQSYLIFDHAGKPVLVRSVRTQTTSTKKYVIAEVSDDVGVMGACASWPAPAPLYSAGIRSLQFGYNVQCDIPIPVRASVVLWSGPTEARSTENWQARVPVNSPWKPGTGSVNVSGEGLCVDWTYPAWWQMWEYAEGAPPPSGQWVQFTPYPGTVLSWLGCLDMVQR